jgi:site-specific recombinase XerD
MDLDQLVRDYLQYLEVDRAYSSLTVRVYAHYLDRFCTWCSQDGASIRPEDIDLDMVRRYRLYLTRVRSPDGRQLGRISQSYHVIALRSLLRYASVQRDLPVLSPDKIQLPRQTSRTVSFLDPDQVERILNSPRLNEEMGLRDRAILETLFSTGVRVSELVSMDRDQVDLRRQEFTVRGKGNRHRIVFLSNSATEHLTRYLQSRQDYFRPVFIRYSGRVESGRSGERMRLTPRSVQDIVGKYAKRVGLSMKVTPHTLRHSFATDLLIGGADLRSVQEMLGHRSIRTTQVYTHVTDRHLKEVHRAFHHRRR